MQVCMYTYRCNPTVIIQSRCFSPQYKALAQKVLGVILGKLLGFLKSCNKIVTILAAILAISEHFK